VNTFQEALLTSSAPEDVQIILAAFIVILAATLLRLVIETYVYPAASKKTVRFLSADYWIKRQKRKGIAYRSMAEQAEISAVTGLSCSKWMGQENGFQISDRV
jgi:hypothetical protein